MHKVKHVTSQHPEGGGNKAFEGPSGLNKRSFLSKQKTGLHISNKTEMVLCRIFMASSILGRTKWRHIFVNIARTAMNPVPFES